MAKKLENLSVGDLVAEKADFDLNQSGQPTADYVSTLFTSSNTSLMGVARYAIGSASSATMADRTTNVYTMNGNVTLVFPAQVADKMRDFLLVVTCTGAGSITLPTGVQSVGDTLTLAASKTYLIAFTEIAADKFYVRSIEI